MRRAGHDGGGDGALEQDELTGARADDLEAAGLAGTREEPEHVGKCKGLEVTLQGHDILLRMIDGTCTPSIGAPSRK